MTKRLLVAFLSIFMLKATITAAHNDDEQGPAQKKMRTEAQNSSANDDDMTGLNRYIESTVSPVYQDKIEKYLKKYDIPYTDYFFTQKITYDLLERLFAPLGLSVPDEIAYGDTYRDNNFNRFIGKRCPPTPKAGYYEVRDLYGNAVYWEKECDASDDLSDVE